MTWERIENTGRSGSRRQGQVRKSSSSESQSPECRVSRFGGHSSWGWRGQVDAHIPIIQTDFSYLHRSNHRIIPRKLLHFEIHLSILNWSCDLRSNNTFPFSRSKVTYLKLLNLDGLTLLVDSIPWVPSLKSIKLLFALVHQMLAKEYSKEDYETSVFWKNSGDRRNLWNMGCQTLGWSQSSLCADVMVAVFRNDWKETPYP